MHDVSGDPLQTDRLELRPTIESDRPTFVALFGDEEFMAFSGGTLGIAAANERFDVMLANGAEVPFAKQPIIEGASERIIGYTGVAWFEFEGERRLEFGWRLVPEARGRGYATEAATALLDLAATSFDGEILAMIDPRNEPSKRVAVKLGFAYWKLAEVHGFVDEIYTRRVVGPVE